MLVNDKTFLYEKHKEWNFHQNYSLDKDIVPDELNFPSPFFTLIMSRLLVWHEIGEGLFLSEIVKS